MKINIEKRGDTWYVYIFINGVKYTEEYWLLTKEGAISDFKLKYNLK